MLATRRRLASSVSFSCLALMTVGGLWECRGRLCRATATTSSGTTWSELAGDIQSYAVDVIERVRARAALYVVGHLSQPRNLDTVHIVEAQIPAREQIAPLRSGSHGKAVRRRSQVVACRTTKQIPRQGVVEAVSIVEQAKVVRRTMADVVSLESNAEILVLRDRATSTDTEMRRCFDRRGGGRQRSIGRNLEATCVCAGIHKELSAVGARQAAKGI